MRAFNIAVGIGAAAFISACATTQQPYLPAQTNPVASPVQANVRPVPVPGSGLADHSAWMQTDPRWANETIGGTGERMASDGCLVTAAAMALKNLGFRTDPGDLVKRLKAQNGFTNRGWLIWSGIGRVTGGLAKAAVIETANPVTTKKCLVSGFYPLVRFKNKKGRNHWAVVVGEAGGDFYVRDPAVRSAAPVALSALTPSISGLRCIGMAN